MEFIASKDDDTFLFQISKEELLTIVFGNKYAYYDDDIKEKVHDLLDDLRNGKIENVEIIKRYEKVVEALYNNRYSKIERRLKSLLSDVRSLEKFQNNVITLEQDNKNN